MRKNYFFRTLGIIYQNAPVRFLVCVCMLIGTSAFPTLNLMAANALTARFVETPFRAEGLVWPGAAFFVTLLLNNAKAFINLLGSYLWITAEMALQGALVKKAADKPMLFYDTPEFYRSLQKAKEGYKNAVGTTMMLISAVFVSVLSVVFIAGYLSRIDYRMGAALAVLVVFKGIAYRSGTRGLQILRENQAEDTKKCELLSSYFWGKEARVYGASGHLLDRWKGLNEALAKDRLMTERKNMLRTFFFDCLAYLCYGAVMVLAVYERLRGGDGAGISGIVVLFVAMDSVFANVNTIVMQFGNLAKNASLSKDLFDFLSGEDACPEARQFAEDAAVRLDEVSFRYPSAARDVLRKINLTVYSGENIAVVGKNGSGKSTLVKLLCGLYEPSQGRIYYGSSLELSKCGYENIAAMFQDIRTYCLTLAENVCISQTDKPLDEGRAGEILESVMGERWLAAYPDGIRTKVGRAFGGIELSGGEKQKISLARTFYRTSSVIFFDEPTSALDPLAEDRLYKDILRLSRDKTTFFITHRLSSVKYADRIIVVDGGEIVEEGTFEMLMGRNGLFAEMYSIQKKGLEE